MAFDFDPNIQKIPVVSAPFRRSLYEPVEPAISRPFAARIPFSTPQHQPEPQCEPVIGPDGLEYFPLSFASQQIADAVRVIEDEVHDEFLRKLTVFLTEQWDRELVERQTGTSFEPDMPTDLPPDMYG
jgi:hypothetical protein